MEKRALDNNYSVLIPDGDDANSLAVARSLAEEKNIKVYVLSPDKNDTIQYSRHVSRLIHCSDGKTKEGKLAAIEDAIKNTNADILLPVGVKAIRLIAEHKEQLSKSIALPPLPEVDSFDMANDKWLLSQWAKENNIPHPTTTLFRSVDSLEEIISSITFPVIVKPRNGFGGNGIYKFQNAKEFQSWYPEFEHSEDQIIQSYIKGNDIDCSILCNEGKILAHTIQRSIKYSDDDPWPYGLEFLSHDEILSIVADLAKKFNWSGVAHLDLRYDEIEKRSKLIEINPRFWASVSASIFAGVNFPYLSCLSALKRELPPLKTENKIVVRTGPAVKMTLNRLFKRKNDFRFDNTFFEFILKDPLPTVFSEIRYYYNKFKNR